MPLQGRSILITGGSSGIGKAVAKACLEAGADVAICSRNTASLDGVKQELEATAAAGQRVVALEADVSDPHAVTKLAAATLDALPHLTGLVNAAAVLGPKGLLDETDLESWIATIHVNLIGVMLTCRAFLPHFRTQRYGKIVNFSGGGATAPRPRFSAYAASKAAVVRLTENLATELADTGIFVNAVAPGAVNTRLLDEVLAAGPNLVGHAAYDEARAQKEDGGTPPEKAANLCVMLLAAESDALSGRLISALWDPWQSLAQHKSELAQSDIYTLRRIVPADRGRNWQ